MDIIDFELSRYDQWKDDLEKRRRFFENTSGLCVLPTVNTADSEKKIKVIEDIWRAEGPLKYLVKHPVDDFSDFSKSKIEQLKEDLEKSRERFKNMNRKQEQLLKGLIIVIYFLELVLETQILLLIM